MTINLTVLAKHFTTTAIYELAEEVLSGFDYYDELSDALDDALTCTANQWTMVESYCTPEEANYDISWDDFYNDLLLAIDDGAVEIDEEEDL